jgi:hypothetical protein
MRQIHFEEKIGDLIQKYREELASHKHDLIEVMDNRLNKITYNYEKILGEMTKHETDVVVLQEQS